jgi:hypothetical protein
MFTRDEERPEEQATPEIEENPVIQEDIVRVLRIIEYVGPRSAVERNIVNSIHGSRVGCSCEKTGRHCVITAITLHEFPEVLERIPEEGLRGLAVVLAGPDTARSNERAASMVANMLREQE